jgi:hypothetical protein
MKNSYRKAVNEALARTNSIKREILTENDMSHLPELVRRYIRYTGSVGKEKVINYRAVFTGGIRGKSSEDYMPLRSEQYNFTDNPARLFYIVARKMGIPAKGIHFYIKNNAVMTIKLLGLFTIVDARGPEMDQSETVTLFNDMCFIAPASLIDPAIEWKDTGNHSVSAKFTNGPISVESTLYFDDEGKLVNFLSNDRYETTDGKNYYRYPWLTPVTGYKEINGFRLPSGARLIYKHPDEEFCYGEFNLESIGYNYRHFE